jgi:hypothetical protein
VAADDVKDSEEAPHHHHSHHHHRRGWRRRLLIAFGALTAIYLTLAYVMAPLLWEAYIDRHVALEGIPGITHTGTGIPGDPLNVAIVGTERELKRLMIAAKWYPANPLTLESCLEIAEATVLRRPYDDAPVSSLYYDGRKEDLAFEMPVGPDPRKRHHVRFWRTEKFAGDGRPSWVGSATYDERVGLSDTTGEVTHHIAPDVDAERDHVMETVKATGMIAEEYDIPDFHQVRQGKNGGGDPWHTDGALDVAATKAD